MKMRSAVTYLIGRVARRGNTPWNSDDGIQYRGNPSVSEYVSRYMMALKKRKVSSVSCLYLVFFNEDILQHALGERAMSSRAITSDMIKDIYAIKSLPSNRILRPVQQTSYKDRRLDDWGGPRARALVHLVTVLAFICLLRSDEALSLKMEDIELISPECIRVNLTSRKTSPFGRLLP